MIMFHLDITFSPADAAFTLTFVAVIVRESGRSNTHRRFVALAAGPMTVCGYWMPRFRGA
jgi:hypothetical protein